jgi:hypothetical protein
VAQQSVWLRVGGRVIRVQRRLAAVGRRGAGMQNGCRPRVQNTAGGCPVAATLKVAPATRFSDSRAGAGLRCGLEYEGGKSADRRAHLAAKGQREIEKRETCDEIVPLIGEKRLQSVSAEGLRGVKPEPRSSTWLGRSPMLGDHGLPRYRAPEMTVCLRAIDPNLSSTYPHRTLALED